MKSNKFGYYLVGDEIFTNKVSALKRATDIKIHPSWHYHDDVYKKLPWDKDTDLRLKTLYKMRAKQLREKYDYLVVSFSGGSDSWTIVKTFYDNNIHIDEIFVRWPVKATSGVFSVNNKDKHPSNILSEWQLTIVPAMKEFEKWFPNTKFTVVDWSDRVFNDEVTDDDWLEMLPQAYLNPGAIPKYTSISEDETKAIESGKKSVLIDGIDKPQLCFSNGKIYCYFLDKLVNAHPPEINGRNVEHFYWSVDLPEITYCQARLIYNMVKDKPLYIRMIDKKYPYDHNIKNQWNDFARAIIYQDYVKKNFFQANKSYTAVYDEVDAWLFTKNYKDQLLLQSWRNTYNNIVNSIDQKFFDKKNNEILGYCGFIDKLYCIGPVDPEVYI